MIKYVNGYVEQDGNITRRIKIEEIDRVWFMFTNRALYYSFHVGQGLTGGKVSTFVDERNYSEVVKMLQVIKENNPNVHLCRTSKKILANPDKVMIKGKLAFTKFMTFFMWSLMGLVVFAFLMAFLTGQL